MSDSKTTQSIVRSIKAITKANSSLTPSQKRKISESIIPDLSEDMLDEFTSFFNFLAESRQVIKEQKEQEELSLRLAKEALIETLKGTDAFANSRKSPEEFILELLNSSADSKQKKSTKANSAKAAKTERPGTPSNENGHDDTEQTKNNDTQAEQNPNNSFHQRPSY